jgi:hypothetical protein
VSVAPAASWAAASGGRSTDMPGQSGPGE